MRTTWTFHSAGSLLFGRGAAGQLGEVADRFGARRTLLVADPNLVKAGLVDHVKGVLAAAGRSGEVFAGGEPEPSLLVAADCIEAARGFRPDALVALGGGSNMDLAKITAAVLAH